MFGAEELLAFKIQTGLQPNPRQNFQPSVAVNGVRPDSMFARCPRLIPRRLAKTAWLCPASRLRIKARVAPIFLSQVASAALRLARLI